VAIILWISLICIAALFVAAQIGKYAKFLLTLTFEKKSPTVRGLTAGQRVSAFFRRENMKKHVLY
jgi:hypothetical protein